MKKIILITLLGLVAATPAMAADENDAPQWQQEQMPYSDEAIDDGADQAATDDEASGSDTETGYGGEASQPMDDDAEAQ